MPSYSFWDALQSIVSILRIANARRITAQRRSFLDSEVASGILDNLLVDNPKHSHPSIFECHFGVISPSLAGSCASFVFFIHSFVFFITSSFPFAVKLRTKTFAFVTVFHV